MRILVVGAGAIGGYFGARWLAAHRDVTFLVRERRAAQLAKIGLVLKSKLGDVSLPSPPSVSAETLKGPYDLVLLSCKAFDLEGAMESFAPAVGPNTAILPLLNGIAHLDALGKRFDKRNVLGGQVGISVTLDPEGRVLHLNDGLFLSYGELAGPKSARVEAIAAEFAAAKVTVTASETALLDMWEKWVLIASVAGITCLMRSAIGDVIAAGGQPLIEALHAELIAIATENGFAPRAEILPRQRALLLAKGSPFTASMLRDIEAGSRIEADHVIGDMLQRAKGNPPVLKTAYTHLKAYEARRVREGKV